MDGKPKSELPDFAQRHLDRDSLYQEIRTETAKKIEELAERFRETLRNISVGLGAVGATGIASLGLPAPLKADFLALGGGLLLIIMSAVCFSYLLVTHWKESKLILKFRREKLNPIQNLLNEFDSTFRDGRLSKEEYLKHEAEWRNKGLEEYMRRDLEKDSTEDNIEIYLIVGIIVGIIMLVLSFLLPYLWPAANIFFGG